MKLAVLTLATALMLIVVSVTGATPPAHSAKFQLPEQASDKASPPSKTLELVPPLPPPPQIPPVIVTFTSGQNTNTASQTAAAAAVNEATVTARAKIESGIVAVITIIGKRDFLRETPIPPKGRSGDLEATHWRLSDRRGRRIGDASSVCRWATIGRRLCWGELRLPLGRMVMLGSSQTRLLGNYAIVGGTGAYSFKQGIMSVRLISIGKYVIRILIA